MRDDIRSGSYIEEWLVRVVDSYECMCEVEMVTDSHYGLAAFVVRALANSDSADADMVLKAISARRTKAAT